MFGQALTIGSALVVMLGATLPAMADCEMPVQGDGRIVLVIDARTLRLAGGQDIRLAGLAPLAAVEHEAVARDLLAALVTGRAVTIRADSDTPDRYGRQHAWLQLDAGGPTVQAMLAAQGGALADAGPDHATCSDDIRAAEADARRDRLGIWSDGTVIKNAESPGDILAGIGRFVVVEGRVLSVRQAGSVTYVNFGRRWTRDFAVTMPRRVLPQFEAVGLTPKALEGRRMRVRGIVEQRGGPTGSPRIEVVRPGQIEIIGAGAIAGTSE